jgi:hypothetical protein
MSTAIEIVPYRDEHVDAVRAFNRALREHGVRHLFPERAASAVPPTPERTLFQELFLAREGGAVRGGYVFKHQRMALGGELTPIGNFQFPLSQGLVDPRYAALAARFVRHALKRQPLIYSLGLGGRDEAITRLFQAGGFRIAEVPFYFRVLHAAAFLRQIAPLRTTRLRRLCADALATSGLGALGLWAFERLVQPARATADRSIDCERVASFGPWADEVWARARARYAMVAERSAATLEALYPRAQPRFIRLRLSRAAQTIGWAVLLDTRMSRNKYFGSMRVGTLVDCLAEPEHAEAVVLASLDHLRRAGCDVAISNQSHRAWCSALEHAGFRAGPSNFLLALSPLLAKRVNPIEQRRDEVHINRGDGDGPYNL